MKRGDVIYIRTRDGETRLGIALEEPSDGILIVLLGASRQGCFIRSLCNKHDDETTMGTAWMYEYVLDLCEVICDETK